MIKPNSAKTSLHLLLTLVLTLGVPVAAAAVGSDLEESGLEEVAASGDWENPLFEGCLERFAAVIATLIPSSPTYLQALPQAAQRLGIVCQLFHCAMGASLCQNEDQMMKFEGANFDRLADSVNEVLRAQGVVASVDLVRETLKSAFDWRHAGLLFLGDLEEEVEDDVVQARLQLVEHYQRIMGEFRGDEVHNDNGAHDNNAVVVQNEGNITEGGSGLPATLFFGFNSQAH